jgi:hypothetical protein
MNATGVDGDALVAAMTPALAIVVRDCIGVYRFRCASDPADNFWKRTEK